MILILPLLLMAACGDVQRDRSVPMTTVEEVDLNRYAGRWYEIARYPNFFERGCVAATADYTLREDGKVDVTNACRKETLDGPISSADGIARVAGPGQLEVTFTPWLPGVWGDYWVLGLTPDYTVAVIGAPAGTTGWILARTPQITAEQRAAAEAVFIANGYRLDALEYPPQQ
ncbi:apolipoprotein D and lipocalin family protein [Rubricella aquisinus]|uniref:Outer membrane lipoprotein Blc n=1 Tax=Rubricella aquisinus TaxID=2028108 RepID=A0A840WI20_9RHOB|nr:lipocalin family protein [Rubricella aquisinus]MBB5514121.1 apolipoprotein D and lipocalin family protein [Rubricella aquisinus]